MLRMLTHGDHAGLQEGPGGMGGADDLFSAMFGGGGGFFGGGGQRRQRERRGKNVMHQLKVSLNDMYKGKHTKLMLRKSVICDGCEGIGGTKGSVKYALFRAKPRRDRATNRCALVGSAPPATARV